MILVHDFADHWMELAKMAKYAGFSVGPPPDLWSVVLRVLVLQTVCDLSFVMFMLMWTLRLGIFPSWIIYTTTVEAAHVRI